MNHTILDVIYFTSVNTVIISYLYVSYLHFNTIEYLNRHGHTLYSISSYCTYNSYVNLLFTFGTALTTTFLIQYDIPLPVRFMCLLLYPILFTFYDNPISDIIHTASLMILVIISVVYSHYVLLSVWLCFVILFIVSAILQEKIYASYAYRDISDFYRDKTFIIQYLYSS